VHQEEPTPHLGGVVSPPSDSGPRSDSPNPLAGTFSPSLLKLPFGPPPSPPRRPDRWGRALLLLLATLFFTTTLGALWHRAEGISADEALWASPATIKTVWSDRELLAAGFGYSLPLLLILLCHEMGHYLACRYYKLPVTPPFFLPSPLGLGTFGAFIRIKAPIRRKRELFDIGIAGPLAGFVMLVPFLLYGIAHSLPQAIDMVAEEAGGRPMLVLGTNLATRWTLEIFHGSLPAETGLNFHPAALAAWVGLLATALNLLPLGQLDGGHILYATAGRWQKRLAWPLWFLLLAAGTAWPVWWMWCLFLLFLGLRHPPVWDEDQPLGTGRRILAGVALLIFVVSFMLMPVGVIFVGQ